MRIVYTSSLTCYCPPPPQVLLLLRDALSTLPPCVRIIYTSSLSSTSPTHELVHLSLSWRLSPQCTHPKEYRAKQAEDAAPLAQALLPLIRPSPPSTVGTPVEEVEATRQAAALLVAKNLVRKVQVCTYVHAVRGVTLSTPAWSLSSSHIAGHTFQ